MVSPSVSKTESLGPNPRSPATSPKVLKQNIKTLGEFNTKKYNWRKTMELNGNLSKEVNRIKNAMADVSCKVIFGTIVDELVQNIVSEYAGVVE